MTMIQIPRHLPWPRPPRRKPGLAAAALFAALLATGATAAQTSATPSVISAVIRSDFPYQSEPSPPAKDNRAVKAPAFQKPETLPAPALQWKDSAPPAAKGPVVPLPEFPVTAEKFLPLGNRLDQIDSSIRREESRATPSRLDLILSGDKGSEFLRKFLVSFGDETAEKRAHDASQRIEVLEMQRLVELELPFAAPAEKKRLKADQAALKELSAHKLDQDLFGDPRAKN